MNPRRLFARKTIEDNNRDLTVFQGNRSRLLNGNVILDGGIISRLVKREERFRVSFARANLLDLSRNRAIRGRQIIRLLRSRLLLLVRTGYVGIPMRNVRPNTTVQVRGSVIAIGKGRQGHLLGGLLRELHDV